MDLGRNLFPDNMFKASFQTVTTVKVFFSWSFVGQGGTEGPRGSEGLGGLEGPQGSEGLDCLEGQNGPEGQGGTEGPRGSEGLRGPKGTEGQGCSECPGGSKGQEFPVTLRNLTNLPVCF